MEEARYPVLGKRKSILVLDKSFKITSSLNIEDKGQMIVKGIIVRERLIPVMDDREEYVKTFLVRSAESIDNKSRRIY